MRKNETSRIAVEEQSQVAEARRVARKLAAELGFDEKRQEQVAIVVTEACTNILKYAGRGEILVMHDQAGLEVLAIDHGPGIRNIDLCLRDGFSTGETPGHGLGTIVRLADASDFYSEHGKGLALIARWPFTQHGGRENGRLQLGAVNLAKPGQEICGDSWGVVKNHNGWTLMVADGLGHGYDAHVASSAAIEVLRENPELPLKDLLGFVHSALRATRGAAVAVARVDLDLGKLTFAGVGNIAGQICSGAASCQHLVSVNGTAGHQIQHLREFSHPWPRPGILLLYSDGLSTGTGFEGYGGLTVRDPALVAGVLYRDFSRGHDDATIVVARAA